MSEQSFRSEKISYLPGHRERQRVEIPTQQTKEEELIAGLRGFMEEYARGLDSTGKEQIVPLPEDWEIQPRLEKFQKWLGGFGKEEPAQSIDEEIRAVAEKDRGKIKFLNGSPTVTVENLNGSCRLIHFTGFTAEGKNFNEARQTLGREIAKRVRSWQKISHLDNVVGEISQEIINQTYEVKEAA